MIKYVKKNCIRIVFVMMAALSKYRFMFAYYIELWMRLKSSHLKLYLEHVIIRNFTYCFNLEALSHLI